jgi:Hypothetical chloroplast protein Ycf34
MCICINCLYIAQCSTYKVIQEQHSYVVSTSRTVFNPHKTIIYVNLNNSSDILQIDWDITECLSFLDYPGNWFKK